MTKFNWVRLIVGGIAFGAAWNAAPRTAQASESYTVQDCGEGFEQISAHAYFNRYGTCAEIYACNQYQAHQPIDPAVTTLVDIWGEDGHDYRDRLESIEVGKLKNRKAYFRVTRGRVCISHKPETAAGSAQILARQIVFGEGKQCWFLPRWLGACGGESSFWSIGIHDHAQTWILSAAQMDKARQKNGALQLTSSFMDLGLAGGERSARVRIHSLDDEGKFEYDAEYKRR